jgi:hypothetical protein
VVPSKEEEEEEEEKEKRNKKLECDWVTFKKTM